MQTAEELLEEIKLSEHVEVTYDLPEWFPPECGDYDGHGDIRCKEMIGIYSYSDPVTPDEYLPVTGFANRFVDDLSKVFGCHTICIDHARWVTFSVQPGDSLEAIRATLVAFLQRVQPFCEELK